MLTLFKKRQKQDTVDIETGLQILGEWFGDTEQEVAKNKESIVKYYQFLEKEKKKSVDERINDIVPGFYSEILTQKLVSAIGVEGIAKLSIFILDNVDRFNTKENPSNYKNHNPFPSYFASFVYGFLYYIQDKKFRTRALFESFWEHQSKVRRGIDEQYTRKFLKPFIDAGITTVKEIQQLLIRDWYRWQNAPEGSLYYGASIGPATFYFPNYSWDVVHKQLEQKWREETGKEPKKWGE